MKKIILTSVISLLIILSTAAQEKGSYLTISGNVASTRFNYQMDNGHWSKSGLGFGGTIGYQYFFNRYVGIATGAGLQRYNSYGVYNNSFDNYPLDAQNPFIFRGLVDDDQTGGDTDYELRLSLNNWKERQETFFLEIPLMAMFQTKWGQAKRHGMYFGLGGKAQIPVFGQHYRMVSGDMTALGYYPATNITLGKEGDPDIRHHGFGSKSAKELKNLPQFEEGDLDLKFGVAGAAEIGFLFGLSRSVDLTIGAYVDYGFMDINKGNKNNNGALLALARQEHANNIGGNLNYNGIINSGAIDGKVNPFAIGVKVGLRIKTGKIQEKVIEEKPEVLVAIEETRENPEPPVEPIVVVEPVIVEDAGITDAELAVLSEPIFFDLSKSDLKAPAIMALDRKIEILNKYPQINIIILGNTCDLGNDSINIPLGQRRAEAARDYLESNGVNRIRMSAITQASSHPAVPNTNEENHSKNRRDDFVPSGY